jgi:glycogen operon protein
LAFTWRLLMLRREHPVFRRRRFFQGRRIQGSEVKDIVWFRPDGKEMTDEDWNAGFMRSLGLRLAGDAIEEPDEKGHPVTDDTFLLLLNAHDEPLAFTLPAHKRGVRWAFILDTALPDHGKRAAFFKGGDSYELEARSVVVLCLPTKERPRRAPLS